MKSNPNRQTPPKSRGRWLDPELQARLIQMSEQGMSAAKIAVELGESLPATRSAMWRYGLFAS